MYPRWQIDNDILNSRNKNEWRRSLEGSENSQTVENNLCIELQNLWDAFIHKMVELSDVADSGSVQLELNKKKVSDYVKYHAKQRNPINT